MTKREADDPNRYDDIIDLPHHVSLSRPHMERSDRAAQFSPFAALTGYESAVKETARLTDQRVELDENEREALDKKLAVLAARLGEQPEITVTYFVADERKEGGSYVTARGRVKKIQSYEGMLIFEDGERILVEDIVDMDGGIFWEAEG